MSPQECEEFFAVHIATYLYLIILPPAIMRQGRP